MDHLTRDYSAKGAAQGGPAFMLFGKPFNNLSQQMLKEEGKIKEELLSPRGVDEKGLSVATTSSDEEDADQDLKANYCLEVACTAEEDAHAARRVAEQSAPQPYLSSSVAEPATIRGSREPVRKRKRSDGEAEAAQSERMNMSSYNKARDDQQEGGGGGSKPKAGVWSRCPRCNSGDTKFCYFNNYNVNQPRHFCKNCQRYWTAGGTLRNVPIGAGKRKNKHTLHNIKHGFIGNPTHAAFTDPAAAIELTIATGAAATSPDRPPLPASKPEPLSLVTSIRANTNLELHGNLQSRSSQFNHSSYSNLSQLYPHLQHGATPGLMTCPALQCEYSELARLGPPLGSRSSSVLCYTCPHHGPHGSPRLCHTCQHVQSGSPRLCCVPCPHAQDAESFKPCHTCPRAPNRSCLTAQDYTHHHTRNGMLALSAESERESSDNQELMKDNAERDLPTLADHKTALSLATDLPDSAKKTVSSSGGIKQTGFPEMDPMEVLAYMQRCNVSKPVVACSTSNECKIGGREGCHDIASSSKSHVVQSVDFGNAENVSKHGVGDDGRRNSLRPMVGPLWPCFPNMFWLDPLNAFPHVVRPVLTHQGWALPFVTPCTAEPTSRVVMASEKLLEPTTDRF